MIFITILTLTHQHTLDGTKVLGRCEKCCKVCFQNRSIHFFVTEKMLIECTEEKSKSNQSLVLPRNTQLLKELDREVVPNILEGQPQIFCGCLPSPPASSCDPGHMRTEKRRISNFLFILLTVEVIHTLNWELVNTSVYRHILKYV